MILSVMYETSASNTNQYESYTINVFFIISLNKLFYDLIYTVKRHYYFVVLTFSLYLQKTPEMHRKRKVNNGACYMDCMFLLKTYYKTLFLFLFKFLPYKLKLNQNSK